MKQIKDLAAKLRKFYDSQAQVINSGRTVRLTRPYANKILELIRLLQIEVQQYSSSHALMLADFLLNLFVQNSDGTIGINPFRFGKLEAVLIYLESNDFVCNFAKYINTPWNDIDKAIKKLLEDSANANDRLLYNQVGVLGREIYILLATKIYKPEMNNREDGKKISPADAKGMIESFIDFWIKGESNEDLKNYIKNAVKLAEHVTHSKTDN